MIATRRTILSGAMGAIAAAGINFPIMAAQIETIGLQLYTVRHLFEKDPVGTLERVARIGYREVEFGGANYEKMDHAMLRATLDRLGLRAPSIHVSFDALLNNFKPSAALAKALGADTIVLAYMTPEHRTEQGWQRALGHFRHFATDLKAAGLGFAYHNHDFEFVNKPGGVSLFDRLMRETDPALVKIELDLYWAKRAGEKARALVDRLSDRLYAFHVKDMHSDGSMAAVGAGTIDFAALFKLKGAAGVRHFYVENDQAAPPYLPDITTSFETLRALRF